MVEIPVVPLYQHSSNSKASSSCAKMEDMVKRMVVKSLYNWKTLILVLILFKLIEFYTTPFGGGFSGFPFDTFTHTSVFPVPDDFEKECNIFGIVL